MPKGTHNRDFAHHTKDQAARDRNAKDEAVARDPDIRGVAKRESKKDSSRGDRR